jgi:hypothetical protein
MNAGAFRRVDLLVTVASLGVFGLLTIAVRADMESSSDRVVCMNNLRQISRGFNIWAADHGGLMPWGMEAKYGGLRNTTAPISIPGGGTFPAIVSQNLWFQYFWAREEFGSPSFFSCPTDAARKRASDFSSSPNGGLANIGFQNNAVTYFISAHALNWDTSALLSGDRNIMTRDSTPCPVGFQSVRHFTGSPFDDHEADTGWTEALHKSIGNTAFLDGSVRTWSTLDLRRELGYRGTIYNAEHPATYHLLQ